MFNVCAIHNLVCLLTSSKASDLSFRLFRHRCAASLFLIRLFCLLSSSSGVSCGTEKANVIIRHTCTDIGVSKKGGRKQNTQAGHVVHYILLCKAQSICHLQVCELAQPSLAVEKMVSAYFKVSRYCLFALQSSIDPTFSPHTAAAVRGEILKPVAWESSREDIINTLGIPVK